MRNLTIVDPVMERAEMQTAPGMAHWAGSGPDGAICGKCAFYGYSYTDSSGRAVTKRSRCEKFWRMTGRHGNSLETRQIGCKYFEAEK